MALYKARLWLITATPPLLCVVTRYKSWRINLSYTESRFFFFLFLSSEVNFPSWTTLTELWHVLLSSCHHYTKPLSGLFYWICLENILFIWTHELIIKASLLGTLCWNVYSLIHLDRTDLQSRREGPQIGQFIGGRLMIVNWPRHSVLLPPPCSLSKNSPSEKGSLCFASL